MHIHAQNVANFFDPKAVGLPLAFSDITINGKPVTRGVPVQGEFVEAER
ncbi:MAG: hypothetical protein ACR2OE_15385 [Thermomicrobiales bacterium]